MNRSPNRASAHRRRCRRASPVIARPPPGLAFVIPGRASWRGPGIHRAAGPVEKWIPGSLVLRKIDARIDFAQDERPGMTIFVSDTCANILAARIAPELSGKTAP